MYAKIDMKFEDNFIFNYKGYMYTRYVPVYRVFLQWYRVS